MNGLGSVCAAGHVILWFGALGSLVGAAQATEAFPFTVSLGAFDLEKPEDAVRLGAAIEEAEKETFVYIDWDFWNFWSHDFVQHYRKETGDPGQLTCATIEEAGPRGVTFGGRPNPDNNHLVATITIRPSPDDPFTSVQCESFGADPYVLRIRGFFVAREVRVATAEGYEMQSVKIDPTRIPKKFFTDQRYRAGPGMPTLPSPQKP